ncbi:MAG: hypothetical protein KAS32_17195, partial [Candidatus Peribacteraceae bacterium]|nr:hypothetical protein [Candidatus Peribacteraceae bacterium]
MDKIILTWEDIENDCRTLAANLPSNIKMLLPVTRGGLIIAGILSQILDVRDIRTIGARSYSNENKQEEVDVFYRPNPTYFGVLPTECLIVDDILDSGKTLTKIVQNK